MTIATSGFDRAVSHGAEDRSRFTALFEAMAIRLLRETTMAGQARMMDLLETLPPDFGPAGIFGTLVGKEPELFEPSLARPEMKPLHMEPLVGQPGADWNELAKRERQEEVYGLDQETQDRVVIDIERAPRATSYRGPGGDRAGSGAEWQRKPLTATAVTVPPPGWRNRYTQGT